MYTLKHNNFNRSLTAANIFIKICITVYTELHEGAKKLHGLLL